MLKAVSKFRIALVLRKQSDGHVRDSGELHLSGFEVNSMMYKLLFDVDSGAEGIVMMALECSDYPTDSTKQTTYTVANKQKLTTDGTRWELVMQLRV